LLNGQAREVHRRRHRIETLEEDQGGPEHLPFWMIPSGKLTQLWKIIIFNLVGGFNHLEQYYSVGIIIPNIWKNV
jgi:hypothetical protein